MSFSVLFLMNMILHANELVEGVTIWVWVILWRKFMWILIGFGMINRWVDLNFESIPFWKSIRWVTSWNIRYFISNVEVIYKYILKNPKFQLKANFTSLFRLLTSFQVKQNNGKKEKKNQILQTANTEYGSTN